MFSRPRDDHTKRYVCASRRPGHQLTILWPSPSTTWSAGGSSSYLRRAASETRFWLSPDRLTTDHSGAPWRHWDQHRAACRPSTTTSSRSNVPSGSAGTGRSGPRWSGRWSGSMPRSTGRASSGSCFTRIPGACGPRPTSVNDACWCASS
ncbi:MAG: hypothetical protein ACRD2W_08135 [Acidimicrobiales bacterium]